MPIQHPLQVGDWILWRFVPGLQSNTPLSYRASQIVEIAGPLLRVKEHYAAALDCVWINMYEIQVVMKGQDPAFNEHRETAS